MMTRRVLVAAWLLAAGWPSAGFAAPHEVDPREVAVDRALGGMAEGRRVLPPGQSLADRGGRLPGSQLSPGQDTRITAQDRGVAVDTQVPASQGFGGSGAIGGIAEEPSAPTPIAPSTLEPELPGPGGGGLDTEPGGGDLGGGTEPPAGGDSIIDIDADVGLSDGGVDATVDAGVDTEGGTLLDLDAETDVAAEETPIAVEADATETAQIETDLGVEEGVNDAPASGEIEAGLEADVDASGESDEPVPNPADGLL